MSAAQAVRSIFVNLVAAFARTPLNRVLLSVIVSSLLLVASLSGLAASDDFLTQGGQTLFPIGFYELPAEDAELRRMAEAGVNLVRCQSRADLDRAQAAGLLGWVPVAMQQGPTEALRQRVHEVKDHPALALWEGPDEIVWNFTAYSGLEKTAGFTRADWWRQTPKAVAYAENQAQQLMPRMRDAIQQLKAWDPRHRPFWINEAAESDVTYVRHYLDVIDITGCDYYPVRRASRNLRGVGGFTDRWKLTGRGKPVWMVLQGFSWHAVRPGTDSEARYPTFAESRFMAYDAIAHGARGVLYWGTSYIGEPAFRQSLYALTAELAQLQPFLLAPDAAGVSVKLIEVPVENQPSWGVRACVRRHGEEWLLLLVNEDDHWHQAVEVTGLQPLNGRDLSQLYHSETRRIERGELVTRMQAYEVQVFATHRQWESGQRQGREFGE